MVNWAWSLGARQLITLPQTIEARIGCSVAQSLPVTEISSHAGTPVHEQLDRPNRVKPFESFYQAWVSVSKKPNEAVRTCIGSDTRISGDIQFVGNALIDGYLEGIVKAEGSDSKLTIGERGHVKGSVVVPNLLVNGTIEGKVCVAERLEFGPKARIIGDVRYNLLEISICARVDGKLIHKSEAGLVQEDKKAVAQLSSGIAVPSDAV